MGCSGCGDVQSWEGGAGSCRTGGDVGGGLRDGHDLLPGLVEGQLGFESLRVGDDIEASYGRACAKLGEPEGRRLLGRVVQVDRSLPVVCTPEGSCRAEHAARLIKRTDKTAAVGDWVVLDVPPAHENAVISRILPRKNLLSRPDRGRKGGIQVLAANIDMVFVVFPMATAAANLENLERQLVLTFQSGAEPAIVLSKSDEVGDPGERQGILESVDGIACGIPVISESTQTGEGVEELGALVPAGEVAAMLGKSGVGKSSLLNAIVGGELQRTGSIRESDGAGRHTTIARRMVLLPRGGLLIDSPGLRSFRLTESLEGVDRAFPDIVELSVGCRFRDCTHTREPGCAVIAAVESGELPARRLRSYVQIAGEVRAEVERNRY